MKRSVLVVMIDVMVLSVLSLFMRTGQHGHILPLYRWSRVIEAGIEKEKEFIRKLQEMQQQLSEARESERKAEESARAAMVAEELAKRMEAEAKRKADEAETLARDAEVKARVALDREQEAVQTAERARQEAQKASTQAEQASESARQSELAAKAAEEKRRLAMAEAEAVRLREQDAREKALAAEKRAAEARLLAESAFTREQDASVSSAEANAREAAALARVDLAQMQAFAAKVKAERMESKVLEAEEIKAQAEEIIVQAGEDVQLSRQKEAEALAKAKELEQEKIKAQESAAQAKEQAVEMKSALAETSIREKMTKAELEIKEKEKQAAETALAKVIQSDKGSIWVHRDKAMRRLQVRIRTEDIGAFPNTMETTLYLPLLAMAEGAFIAADFENLLFASRSVQSGGYVTLLELTADDLGGSTRTEVKMPLAVSPAEPRICFAMISQEKTGLAPIGLARLKEQRVRDAVLFKIQEPDKSIKVFVTPVIFGSYVTVTPLESGFKLGRRIRPQQGDYILTENGDFIGIMVSREKCYVVPPSLPPADQLRAVPIDKQPAERVYSAFVAAVRDISGMIKRIQDD